MASLKVFRVSALPVSTALENNAIYYVANGEYVETYVVGNSASSIRRIHTGDDIQTMIDDSISNFNNMYVASDIAARDALVAAPGFNRNIVVLVLNATADATVASGAATYVYDAAVSTWRKIAEHESMDLTFDLDWSKITNGPTSTPSEIDAAVTDSHNHMNKDVLDMLGVDMDGNLTYNNVTVGTAWGSTSW